MLSKYTIDFALFAVTPRPRYRTPRYRYNSLPLQKFSDSFSEKERFHDNFLKKFEISENFEIKLQR